MVYDFNQLTKKIVWETKDVLCFVLNLKGGQTIPPHSHENSTLILTVLTGSGDISVSGNQQRLVKGDTVLVKGQDEFGVTYVDEHLSMLATLSPNPSDQKYSKEV